MNSQKLENIHAKFCLLSSKKNERKFEFLMKQDYRVIKLLHDIYKTTKLTFVVILMTLLGQFAFEHTTCYVSHSLRCLCIQCSSQLRMNLGFVDSNYHIPNLSASYLIYMQRLDWWTLRLSKSNSYNFMANFPRFYLMLHC